MIDSYKIIEAAKDARYAGDVAYFVVEFYSGNQLVCVEDFQMPHLRTTSKMPVVAANGDYMLNDGKTLNKKEIEDAQAAFIAEVADSKDKQKIAAAKAKHLDPVFVKWSQLQRQIALLDVKQQVVENIRRHIATLNAEGLSGDRRDKSIRPQDKQQAGISQHPEIQAMKGVKQ